LGQAPGRIAWLSLDLDNVLFATSVGQRDQRYAFRFLPAPPNVTGRSEHSMLISRASTSSDDPNSNPAVRNLALDHTGSMMFERNYLSRILRYSTQNAYWGRNPDSDSAKAASRIGCLRDPRRPRRLTEKQSQQIRREPKIIELCDVRDRLRAEIVSKYGVVRMAEGEPIYEDYQKLRRTLNSTIRAEERAFLQQIQKEYDVTAPVIDIQRQLNGELSDDDDDDTSGSVTIQLKFVERRRIAEASLCDPSTFRAEKGFRRHIDISTDMIALCKRRERRRPRTYRSQGGPIFNTADDEIILPNLEPEEVSFVPLKCTPFQCLFCLTSVDLPLEERHSSYKSKFSLQRHTDRCRLNKFGPDERMSCPDPACEGVVLESKIHFKNHAARVHHFIL
jgi:Protein of unknown function (DUF3435)